MKILWKSTVFAEFRTIFPKLYGNGTFQTRKLGEISVFYGNLQNLSKKDSLESSIHLTKEERWIKYQMKRI